VTAPTVPPVAREASRLGAKAYASHYIDLLNHATVTGDTAPLQEAASRCAGCDRYVELFDRVYDGGGFIDTEGWVPFSKVVVPEGPGFIVSIQVVSKPQRYRESSDGPVHTAQREVFSLSFSLERLNGGWTITGMQGREVDQ
jgi:hypothetical protein